jgi:hypothetical protein
MRIIIETNGPEQVALQSEGKLMPSERGIGEKSAMDGGGPSKELLAALGEQDSGPAATKGSVTREPYIVPVSAGGSPTARH